MTVQQKESGKYGRKSGGQFAAGNPGKPLGARHKTTLAVEALLDQDAENLTRKAIDLALTGDVTALRLCMDRIAPVRKGRVVAFDLPPTDTPGAILTGLSAVVQAVADGTLTSDEGTAIAALLDLKRKAMETVDIERRIAALEGKAE